MPPLDEETALFMPITDPRISLTEATKILRQQDAIIAADPAVAMVVGKVGRAETSTDPALINMSETTITFKPKDRCQRLTRTQSSRALMTSCKFPE